MWNFVESLEPVTKTEENFEEIEEDLENYFCSKCDESFPKLLRLAKHFNKKHRRSKDPYLCPICPDIDFDTLDEVTDHVKSDHSKPFNESRYQRYGNSGYKPLKIGR